MKKVDFQIVFLLALISSAQSVKTIYNQNGKVLKSDYVSQVFEETEKLIESYNQMEERSQKLIPNKMFLQDTQSTCSKDDECLNDGICYEKQCYCKTLFVGPICQYQLNSPPEVGKLMFLIICICSVIAGILLMKLLNFIIQMRQEAKLQREGEYNDNKYEIWSQ